MRNKVLSFLSAVVVAVGVFTVRAILQPQDDGQAMAAAGIHAGRDIASFDLSNAEIRRLRRSISVHPDTMLVLKGAEIRALLPSPDLVRQDGTTTMWQFRDDTCVLDLYFKGKPAQSNIMYYEARARQGQLNNEAQALKCIQQLTGSTQGLSILNVSAMFKSGQ